MWNKKTMLTAAVMIAVTAFGANQAYALNDDEAALLVGLAVGTVAAVAVKHHREHDRRDWQYRDQSRYNDHHRPPQRVEHYVIHNPPQYRERHKHRHDRYCDDRASNRKKHRRGHGYSRAGYEYEYKYEKRVRF